MKRKIVTQEYHGIEMTIEELIEILKEACKNCKDKECGCCHIKETIHFQDLDSDDLKACRGEN